MVMARSKKMTMIFFTLVRLHCTACTGQVLLSNLENRLISKFHLFKPKEGNLIERFHKPIFTFDIDVFRSVKKTQKFSLVLENLKEYVYDIRKL